MCKVGYKKLRFSFQIRLGFKRLRCCKVQCYAYIGPSMGGNFGKKDAKFLTVEKNDFIYYISDKMI